MRKVGKVKTEKAAWEIAARCLQKKIDYDFNPRTGRYCLLELDEPRPYHSWGGLCEIINCLESDRLISRNVAAKMEERLAAYGRKRGKNAGDEHIWKTPSPARLRWVKKQIEELS
jgi:hypothetical protein